MSHVTYDRQEDEVFAVRIRTCHESDLPSCTDLFCEVFSEPPYGEKWSATDAHAYLGRFWRIEPSTCLVAVQDAAIEGALFAYSYPYLGQLACLVQELYVRRCSRRRGIGRALIEDLLRSLGTQVSVCLVAHEGAPAAAFYEKLGLAQHRYYKFYCGQPRKA